VGTHFFRDYSNRTREQMEKQKASREGRTIEGRQKHSCKLERGGEKRKRKVPMIPISSTTAHLLASIATPWKGLLTTEYFGKPSPPGLSGVPGGNSTARNNAFVNRKQGRMKQAKDTIMGFFSFPISLRHEGIIPSSEILHIGEPPELLLHGLGEN